MENSMKPKKGLLETLAGESGCMYLSDLHREIMLPHIYYAVSEIAADSYPLSEWRDSIRYIAGEESVFQAASEAREWLLTYAWERQKIGEPDREPGKKRFYKTDRKK